MRMLALSLSLLCTLGVAHAADAPPFEGTGRAPISGGDRVRARDRALDEAFQHAIEAAVSALLGPETLVRRAADLRLKILPRARSYVTTYRLVDEGEREAGFFTVQLSAGVAADRLIRELGEKPGPSAPTAPGSVRVLTCASTGGLRLDEALRGYVTGRGLSPVTVPVGGCEGEALGTAIKGAGARAALVAEVKPGSSTPVRGTALVGSEVELTLRLVEPDGRRSAEGKSEGAGYGKTAEAAVDDAAVTALTQAGSAIEGALEVLAPHAGGGAIVARVVGVRRFAQLATVRSALERIPGVESVEPRRFQPGSPGAAGAIELQVRTQQSPRALVEALGRVGATYQLRAREADGAMIIDVPEALDPVTAPPQPTGAPQ